MYYLQMDEPKIISWIFSQIGFWIFSGIVGSLIVAWIMGFFDHGPNKSPIDIEYEKEREKQYKKENTQESMWPILILVIIVAWFTFS